MSAWFYSGVLFRMFVLAAGTFLWEWQFSGAAVSEDMIV